MEQISPSAQVVVPLANMQDIHLPPFYVCKLSQKEGFTAHHAPEPVSKIMMLLNLLDATSNVSTVKTDPLYTDCASSC